MSLLSRLFPAWALKREISRRRLEVLAERRFKTKSTYRRLATDTSSADSALAPAAADLRARSRHLAENHDLYIAILSELVSQIVGTGLHVEPMGVSNTGRRLQRWNEQAQRVWDDWTEYPESTGEVCWHALQRHVAWAWLQDGEVFLQHVTNGYPWKPRQLRYVVAQLEADYCPIDWTPANPRQEQWVQGISHDQWGRPTVYHFFKEHPGNLLRPWANNLELREVPASEVTHLKFTRRWPQVRGQPIAHAAFNRLADLAEYEQSEQIAAKVGATLAAFLEKDLDLAGPQTGAQGDASQRIMEMAAGSVYELLPGEKVATVKSERPNPELTNFRASQLRAATGGAHVKYSTVARDYSGSYSAARQEMVEAEGRYMELREHYVRHFLQPVYRRVMRAALMAGRLELPATTTFERACQFEVAGPGVPWIDPLKEAQADVLLLEHRLASRAQILRKRGVDPVQLAMQLEVEDAEPAPSRRPQPTNGVSDESTSETESGDDSATIDEVGGAAGDQPGRSNGDGRDFH